MNNISKTTMWVVGIIIVIFGLFVWSAKLQNSDPNLVSSRGIHWHPQVHIFIDGEEQVLPENIGLDNGHSPLHTHEDAGEGVVHMEYPSQVKAEDVMLRTFFSTWGKSMDEFGNLVKMTVNGEDNNELGDYKMQNNDVINLYYESK